MNMSPDATTLMDRLAAEYAKKKFPNHYVWTWTFDNDEDADVCELRALGLIETFGGRGPKGFAWRFTDQGQAWATKASTPKPQLQSTYEDLVPEKVLRRAEDLIALATNPAASEEERRTSAVIAVQYLRANSVVALLRDLIHHCVEIDKIRNE